MCWEGSLVCGRGSFSVEGFFFLNSSYNMIMIERGISWHKWGRSGLRSRIYGYGVAGVVLAVLVFLIMGTGNWERITLAEDKMITVQVWGVGLEGATLPPEDAKRFVRLVNLAENYREKTCCTNEGMPASRAVIHLAADDVAVSYWGPELLALSHQFGTYWVDQPELEQYMRELAEFK